MAQNDVLSVAVVVNVDGEDTACVFHVQQTSAGTPSLVAQYEQVRDAYIAEAHPSWLLRTSFEATLICLKIQRISPIREPAAVFTFEITGSIVGDSCPAINGALHGWYTAMSTGRGRGRKWWSGIPKAHVARNNLLNPGLTAEQTFAATFTSPWVSTETYDPGIWSTVGEVFNAVVAVAPRVVIRNLTSRKPRSCV